MTDKRQSALAGGLTVGFFLAATELFAALLSGAPSALVSWGTVVIDSAPRGSVEAAIRALGTSDKPVLTVAMVCGACGVGVTIGGLSRGRRSVVVSGLVALAVLDVLSGLRVPDASLLWLTVAAVASSVIAFAAWALLVAQLKPTAAAPGEQQSDDHAVGRRRFLGVAASLAGLALFGGFAGRMILSGISVAAPRSRVRLPRPVRSAPPIPDTAQAAIPGISPLITPNGAFYRVDTALLPPSIDPASWSLRITGMVGHPHEVSFADLLAMPTEEQVITVCCVSNDVGGPLIGTARWLGVPLRAVLEAGQPHPTATELVARSVDGFTASFPLEMVTDGRPALLAIGMNGEPLPFEHGFPARLVVGGLYGFTSAVKWLDGLELGTSSARDDGYWAQRGWTPDAPIRTESRIDTPAAYAVVAPGTSPIAGVAWAPGRGIGLVELQIDSGPWQRCSLGADLGPWAWRQWSKPWQAASGPHQLRVRATANDGTAQDQTQRQPFPDGASGLHTVAVRVQ